MTLLTRSLCFCLLSVFSLSTFSQKFQITQSGKAADNYSRQFFLVGDDHYLALHYMKAPKAFRRAEAESLTLETYDKEMRFQNSKTIEGFKDFRFLSGTVSGNFLHAFIHEESSGNVLQCKIDIENAKLLERVNLFNAPDERMTSYDGASPDGAFHFVMTGNRTEKEKTFEYHGAVLDNKMQLVNRFNIQTDDEVSNFINASSFITNEGNVYIVRSREGSSKKSDYRPVEYVISQVKNDGKHTQTILNGLPEGSIKNLTWMASANELHFVGTLSPYSTKGFTTLITGAFNPATKKMHDLKETDLTTFTNIDGAADQTIRFFKEKGISEEANFEKYFPLKNGGMRVLLEIHNFLPSGLVYSPSITPSIRPYAEFKSTSPRYYARGLYVCQIDRNGKLEWIRFVNKNQEETAHKFFIGTFAMLDSDENLHLFFHDNAKNDKIDNGVKIGVSWPGAYNVGMAVVSIKSDGTTSKQFIYEKEKLFYNFAVENAVQVAPNELIFDSFSTIGKMSYQIGKIVLKPTSNSAD